MGLCYADGQTIRQLDRRPQRHAKTVQGTAADARASTRRRGRDGRMRAFGVAGGGNRGARYLRGGTRLILERRAWSACATSRPRRRLRPNASPRWPGSKAEVDRLAGKIPTSRSWAPSPAVTSSRWNAPAPPARRFRRSGPRSPPIRARRWPTPRLRVPAKRRRGSDSATARSCPSSSRSPRVDGRKVDLRDLRGKVVLGGVLGHLVRTLQRGDSDIKKLYAADHAKGFEVVGIALENASPTPTLRSSGSKSWRRRVRSSSTLTAKQEMPWPQYFDGKYRQNTIAVDYLINSIPAMFLIGEDGRIITMHAPRSAAGGRR